MLEVVAGFLVVVALIVGMIAGACISYYIYSNLLASNESEKRELERTIAQKQHALDMERITSNKLHDQLKKVSEQAKEAGLKVVATVTGKDSMKLNFDAVDSRNIAGGYRYDQVNS